jgi:hypothetical protein
LRRDSYRQDRPAAPSASAYMVAASAAAAALFFILWWMLQDEENPWVPAGLAASVVMLVAASARGVVMRRVQSRHILESSQADSFSRSRSASGNFRQAPLQISQTELLRAIEKQSSEANASESLPDSHLKVFQLCGEFLQVAEKALTSPNVSSERRLTVQARHDRVGALQKHHMLAWARDSARLLTHEAQQHARLHEKISTANRALACIDVAAKQYPDIEELNRSGAAVREFMTSSRVAHWVELAQRATFKGRLRRAIDCYRDALYYLSRAEGDHQLAAEQITREIELLRARIATRAAVDSEPPGTGG